jgi:hypothetical protein
MMETISLILGSVLPPFIDLLTKKVPNTIARFAISFVVCLLIAVAINYQKLSGEEILESVGLVFTAATVVYKTYWKNSTLRSEDNR